VSEIPIQAGIIVSGRGHNAVQRNRVKRLLREAFSGYRQLLTDAARTSGRGAILVFVFKGSKDLPVEKIQLSHIQQDIAKCCKALAVRL
jgi:ribonuclease P protein component